MLTKLQDKNLGEFRKKRLFYILHECKGGEVIFRYIDNGNNYYMAIMDKNGERKTLHICPIIVRRRK